MRVLLDVSAVPAQPVGAGAYVINLVRALHDNDGADLHLLARRDDGPRWAALAPSATVHALVPGPRPARLVWEQVRGPAAAASIQPDVWHGPHYTLPLRLAVPTVVTVHDMTFFDHPEWHERSKAAFFRPMTRGSVARATEIVAVSDVTSRRLTAVLAPRAPVTVIPHGVDHERFRPPTTDQSATDVELLRGLGVRAPYIVFVGTIEPRKDIPTLVHAFARATATSPELRLVLAGGDGWGTVAVREAIAHSGAATRVLRLGYVPAPAVPALLRHAELACYPALVEGFGLPALEALACGAALVTTKGTAMEDVAGAAAFLVPPGNCDALADAIGSVLSDPAERDRLRQLGPEIAAPYTWAASAAAHVEVYRRAQVK